jgi:hypothetical protein
MQIVCMSLSLIPGFTEQKTGFYFFSKEFRSLYRSWLIHGQAILYAMRRKPILYKVSITLLDQKFWVLTRKDEELIQRIFCHMFFKCKNAKKKTKWQHFVARTQGTQLIIIYLDCMQFLSTILIPNTFLFIESLILNHCGCKSQLWSFLPTWPGKASVWYYISPNDTMHPFNPEGFSKTTYLKPQV